VTLAAISCSTVCWFGGLSSLSRAAAVAAMAAVVAALARMACSAAAVSVSSHFWEMLSECRTVARGRHSITVSAVPETR